MGRHTAAAGPADARTPWGKVIGFLVAAAVVVGVGWFAVSAIAGGDSADGATAAVSSVDCDEPLELHIATTEDAFRPLNALAVQAEASSDTCVDYFVTAAPSPALADAIAKGETLVHEAPIDAWVPDSNVWFETVEAKRTEKTPVLTPGPTLATSPVVAAVPPGVEGIDDSMTWPDIFGSENVNWVLPEPQTYTSSLTTVMTIFGSQDQGVMRDFVIGLNERLMSSGQAYNQANTEQAGVFPASEQQIASYNAVHANGKLSAVAPKNGVTQLHYTWVEVGEHAGAEAEALAHFVETTTSDEGQKLLNEKGFRTEGVTDVGVEGVPAEPDFAIEKPTLQQLADMNAQFLTLATPMRLLAVMDISGSMKETDGANNMSRIQLASAASAGALALMDDSTSVGVWVFSTGLDGSKDYRVVEPIENIVHEEDGKTQREQLTAALKKMPTNVHGDTGLYDTFLAAYKKVLETYDPNTSNTLIFITDGANDDTTGGISFDELRSEIDKLQEPGKTVAIVNIGVGKDADMATLKKLAELSRDGNAYHTVSPQEIGAVFVDAFLDYAGKD